MYLRSIQGIVLGDGLICDVDVDVEGNKRTGVNTLDISNIVCYDSHGRESWLNTSLLPHS
jgi:hypothetical protein